MTIDLRDKAFKVRNIGRNRMTIDGKAWVAERARRTADVIAALRKAKLVLLQTNHLDDVAEGVIGDIDAALAKLEEHDASATNT